MFDELLKLWPFVAGSAAGILLMVIKPTDSCMKRLFKIEKAVCPYCGSKTLDPQKAVFKREPVIFPEYCGICGAEYKAKIAPQILSSFVWLGWVIAFSFTPKWLWFIACLVGMVIFYYAVLKLFRPIVKPRKK